MTKKTTAPVSLSGVAPSQEWGENTRQVRAGLERSPHGETSEALYLSSGFVYPDGETARDRFAGDAEGFIYSRYGNPTVATFEQRLAAIEGAEACFGTASGMAAVYAALTSQLSAGDHIVASRVLFGSCAQIITKILPRFGVDFTLVDGRDLSAWEAAFRSNTKAVFFESPANPTLDLVDIQAVCDLAHAHGACVILDNAFASPVVQKSMPLGVDIVVYSATKHIDGQGRCLGGAVLATEAFITDTLMPFVRHTGPALSPFNAWVLTKGLETLSLRVDHQARSAATLADFLADRPEVNRILYPFQSDFAQVDLARRQMKNGGTIVSFDVEGGQEAAFALLRELQLIDISNNLGDAKSLITHPATTTHRVLPPEQRAEFGITDGLLRISVGLEDVEDIQADLDRAFARSGAASSGLAAVS